MFGNAESYDRFMGRWSRLLAPLLVDFTAVPESGRVLDIGSGIGTLAFAIAEGRPGRHVTGIDPSQEFVSYAMSNNPLPDKVGFLAGDAERLPFADASFVAALSSLVFNFVSDPETALREARRVTCSGGRIAAAVWDYGGHMQMLRAFWDAAAEADPEAGKLDERHMPLCREGELSRLWQQSGITNVEEQALDITMGFASFARFWDPFLLGQGPAGAYLRPVQGEPLEKLRDAVKRRLGISSESNAFNLPARAWAVRGTVP